MHVIRDARFTETCAPHLGKQRSGTASRNNECGPFHPQGRHLRPKKCGGILPLGISGGRTENGKHLSTLLQREMTLWGGANRFGSGFARRAAGHRRFQKFAPMHVIVSLSQLPAVHEQQDTVDIAGIIRREKKCRTGHILGRPQPA